MDFEYITNPLGVSKVDVEVEDPEEVYDFQESENVKKKLKI